MSIKNFTVISKRIKEKSDGLIKYINYLEEKEHGEPQKYNHN